MEQVQHTRHQSRKKASTKTSVAISFVIHLVIIALCAYWAAHEGFLGSAMRELSVSMIPKGPKKEDPKKAEAKEALRQEEQALKNIKTTVAANNPAPPKFIPPAGAGDAVAPPPAEPAVFTFDPNALGGTGIGAGSDAIARYKQQVEDLLRARWERPTDVQDDKFVADVEVAIDAQGKVLGHTWKKGSGDAHWDDSVKRAIAGTKAISRPPPKGFPEKFLVRFDVLPPTEPLISRAD